MLSDHLKILVVPDSFKGSASSLDVSRAIISGIEKVLPGAKCTGIPMADGGEGSLDAIQVAVGGQWVDKTVLNPMGEEVEARFLIKDHLAFVELAQASGLQLIDESQRDPLLYNTYGTGQLLKAALDAGASELVLCIGGSATNDGGTGIACALGYEFLDRYGNAFIPDGNSLASIAGFRYIYERPKPKITVLCDVDNPFTGPDGATYTYGPQKGANEKQLEILETGMLHLQQLIKEQCSLDLNRVPGSGAAGGVGGGMVAFFDASLEKGIDYFIRHLQLEKLVSTSDLIFTGEGKIDQQTKHGKLISGIVALARRFDKPVLAVCGALELDAREVEELGILAAFSIQQRVQKWEEARRKTLDQLSLTVTEIMKVVKYFQHG